MKLRLTNIRKLGEEYFDVLVIGGGINGAVSAAALTARGAKVALIDRGDFACETSQQSSNLAWGGIKYLESFELALVRKLCLSRNRLIDAYPSTVQEIRFYVAHQRDFRHPRWKLAAGAWLYWLMGNCKTATPRLLSSYDIAAEEPIVRLDSLDGGLEYSDAYLHDNDARFVFNFVRTALSYGCIAANYVESLGSVRTPNGWETRARDCEWPQDLTIRSRMIVNACGPWVDAVNQQSGIETSHKHVFSKGIHLITRKLTPSQRVLTFFADDGRLFFVVPMGPRTCIGTTDNKVEQPSVDVTDDDRRFVLDNINKRLRLQAPLGLDDIIAERCGVRPLVVPKQGPGNGGDWLHLSRKHVIASDEKQQHVSILGGKLTDCLNVGEEICDEAERLAITLPHRQRRWYGEPTTDIHEEFLHQAKLMRLDALTSAQSSEPLTSRLWRRYAGQAIGLLENIRADPSVAEVLIEGAEYLRCEIEQAARREMITRLDDFLRRRSKISLVIKKEDLLRAKGLKEACRILFGQHADERLAQWSQTQ